MIGLAGATGGGSRNLTPPSRQFPPLMFPVTIGNARSPHVRRGGCTEPEEARWRGRSTGADRHAVLQEAVDNGVVPHVAAIVATPTASVHEGAAAATRQRPQPVSTGTHSHHVHDQDRQ
ncbi:hypothetical protein HBB16_02430 [Pseudonocardia sp. MCCB 268]|nr:hypothetical protein [Pseudonocardia cytotoxica]